MWKLRNFGCSSETAAHINHLDARTYLCLLSLAKCLGRSRRWVAASTGTTIFSPAMVYVCCWRGWRRVVSTCCVCFGDFRPTSFVCPHLSRTTLSLAQQLPLLALHLTSRCGIVEVVVATGVAKGREGERKDEETSDFVCIFPSTSFVSEDSGFLFTLSFPSCLGLRFMPKEPLLS